MKSKPVAAIPLNERPTVTVDELCLLIGVGRSTIYRAIRLGELRPRKLGKRTLITQEEWRRFVANMPRQATVA